MIGGGKPVTARSTKSKVKEAFGLANTAATAAAPEYGIAVAGATVAHRAGKRAYGRAVTTVNNFRIGDYMAIAGWLIASFGWFLWLYQAAVGDLGWLGSGLGGNWEKPIIPFPGGGGYAIWDLLITGGGALMILGGLRANTRLMRWVGLGGGIASVGLDTLLVVTWALSH